MLYTSTRYAKDSGIDETGRRSVTESTCTRGNAERNAE